MTQILKQLLEKVSQLPEADQNEIGARWLEELADDERWERSFRDTEESLGRWVAKIKRDIADGKTIEKGWDEL